MHCHGWELLSVVPVHCEIEEKPICGLRNIPSKLSLRLKIPERSKPAVDIKVINSIRFVLFRLSRR